MNNTNHYADNSALIANMQKTIDEANQEVRNLQFDIDTYMAIAKDQLSEIQYLRAWITDNCVNTAGKEVNGNRLSASAKLALSSPVSEKAK